MISLHKRGTALILSVWFRNFLLRADQIHQLNHAFVQIDQSLDRLGAAFSWDISPSLVTCRGLLHSGNITIIIWPVLTEQLSQASFQPYVLRSLKVDQEKIEFEHGQMECSQSLNFEEGLEPFFVFLHVSWKTRVKLTHNEPEVQQPCHSGRYQMAGFRPFKPFGNNTKGVPSALLPRIGLYHTPVDLQRSNRCEALRRNCLGQKSEGRQMIEFEPICCVKNSDGFHVYLAAGSQYGGLPIREFFKAFGRGAADDKSRETGAAQRADSSRFCRYIKGFV